MDASTFVGCLLVMAGAGVAAAVRYEAAPVGATDAPTVLLAGILVALLGALLWFSHWAKESLFTR